MTAAVTAAHQAYSLSAARGVTVTSGIDAFALGWSERLAGRPRTASAALEEAALVLAEIDFYRHRSGCLAELAHCHALVEKPTKPTSS